MTNEPINLQDEIEVIVTYKEGTLAEYGFSEDSTMQEVVAGLLIDENPMSIGLDPVSMELLIGGKSVHKVTFNND